MDKAALTHICTVYIPVADEQQAIAWYQEKLDLQWNGYWFQLPTGPTIFLVQAKAYH